MTWLDELEKDERRRQDDERRREESERLRRDSFEPSGALLMGIITSRLGEAQRRFGVQITAEQGDGYVAVFYGGGETFHVGFAIVPRSTDVTVMLSEGDYNSFVARQPKELISRSATHAYTTVDRLCAGEIELLLHWVVARSLGRTHDKPRLGPSKDDGTASPSSTGCATFLASLASLPACSLLICVWARCA